MLTAPKGYEPTKGPVFDGGSSEDRDAVLKLYYDYWLANDKFDGDALLKVWDHSDANIFFNTNGQHQGVDDWSHPRHYKKLQTHVEPLGLGDVRIMIRGDMAFIAADRILRWWADIKTGDKPARADVPVLSRHVRVREERWQMDNRACPFFDGPQRRAPRSGWHQRRACGSASGER